THRLHCIAHHVVDLNIRIVPDDRQTLAHQPGLRIQHRIGAQMNAGWKIETAPAAVRFTETATGRGPESAQKAQQLRENCQQQLEEVEQCAEELLETIQKRIHHRPFICGPRGLLRTGQTSVPLVTKAKRQRLHTGSLIHNRGGHCCRSGYVSRNNGVERLCGARPKETEIQAFWVESYVRSHGSLRSQRLQ